ncbi:MAG: asparagine synthase (glutamine-hydrolyzing) [Patescibacteria group bacterium]
MCGIAGKIQFGNKVVEKKDLLLMSQKIIHRGPDDEGLYVSDDKKVGLVNRRLAIIDLSKNGHMPMVYKNKYVITYNGEVYNFQSERRLLEKQGYRFNSNSDTEVILALYDKYGVSCLEHLRGMFAFAIYDKVNNKVFIARDRLGKKPVKYYLSSEVFIFASELKAILTQDEVKKEPDYEAIGNYLTFGYVPSPLTGFVGIKKLEPGHYLIIDLKNPKLKKEKYWKPNFSKKLSLSENDWKEKILTTLEESTKLRMISDVPIGVFLSGGVDSSAVTAMMAKNSNTPVKTFTIGFKEKSHDERGYAKKISEMYQTDHTEFMVEPESIEILPKLIRQFEEPYANSSFIISYLVAKAARQKVTVILNGDGGDENFAGYDSRMVRLNRDVSADRFGPLLNTIGLQLAKLLGKNQIIKFLEKRKTPLADRYLSYNCYFDGDIQSHILVRNKFDESGASDLRDRALYYDLTQYFPDDLLAKSDLSNMLVSLEGRSPFADHKMVELACQIPFDLKYKNGITKYILKKSLEDIVPKENMYRQKKGFSIPLGNWFSGNLKKYAEDKLLKKNTFVSKLIGTEKIKVLLESHSSKNDMGLKLWNLLALQLWFDDYFN